MSCHEQKAMLRAQVSSMDVVLSIMVFMLIMVFMVGFWSQSVFGAKNALSKNRLEYAAIAATDVMVKSPGYPSNWEQDAANAQMLGLASSPYELSASKLANFTALNRSKQQGLLGAYGDFFFSIDSANGTRLYQAGNASANFGTHVSLSRFATLGGQAVLVRLTLYG